MSISVAQHIFASLTRDQSPVGRGGYQTLGYTHERLTDSEVRAIEERALFKVKSDGETKWQYFWLPTGKAVITQFVSIPEPDEFGRKGRYLAHSVILTASEWISLGGTPFRIMTEANFCQTISQAIAAGNLKTSELGRAEITVGPDHSIRTMEAAKQWEPAELWKLLRLANHPRGMAQQRRSVAFVGDPGQILETLQLTFQALSRQMRTECSFDTSAVDCSWPRDVTFWAVGFVRGREAPSAFQVDTANKKVIIPPDWDPPRVRDENYLKLMIDKRDFSFLKGGQESVYLLSEALEGRLSRVDEVRRIPESTKRVFAEANKTEIKARILGLFPEVLPNYILEKLILDLGHTPEDQLEWLIKNPSSDKVNEILFNFFSNWGETPSDKVFRAISPLVSDHCGFRLLLALWSKNEKETQQSLSAMSAEQYQFFIPKVFSGRGSKPYHFFSAKHLDLWFAIFKNLLTLDDIANGIAVAARQNSELELAALKGIVPNLRSADHGDALLEWLVQQPFRKRVKQLRLALEQSVSTQTNPVTDADPTPDRRGMFRRLVGR